MNDRALSLLEKYDIEVLRTKKGRSAFICDTNQGCVIWQEYNGRPEKLQLQQQFLQRIREIGLVQVEELFANKEGQLYVQDSDGTCYILKRHFEGCECNIYDTRECVEAMQLLARLHHCMEGTLQEPVVNLIPYSLLREYEKHNREMMRVRSYLKKKGQKQMFERRLLGVMEYFLNQAHQVTEEWRNLENIDPTCYCHGDYQHHNILRTRDGWCVINFEKLQSGNPVQDVYLFLRKAMEKNDWQVELGWEMLEAYEAIRSLDAYSRQELYYRFAYPEKFWKIVNFYYNSAKVWIPEKNLEKLEKVIRQEQEKRVFLGQIF